MLALGCQWLAHGATCHFMFIVCVRFLFFQRQPHKWFPEILTNDTLTTHKIAFLCTWLDASGVYDAACYGRADLTRFSWWRSHSSRIEASSSDLNLSIVKRNSSIGKDRRHAFPCTVSPALNEQHIILYTFNNRRNVAMISISNFPLDKTMRSTKWGLQFFIQRFFDPIGPNWHCFKIYP